MLRPVKGFSEFPPFSGSSRCPCLGLWPLLGMLGLLGSCGRLGDLFGAGVSSDTAGLGSGGGGAKVKKAVCCKKKKTKHIHTPRVAFVR